MPALPRKTGSSSTGGLAVVAQQRAAAAALAKQSVLPSPQYLDAINVLSEATMAEACALLLSEKDYENDSGENSDYQRLLEIEKKCREAVKVVHKQAIPAPSASLMMPPSMPTIPAARVNTAVKKTATKTSMVTAPKTLVGKSITPTAGKPGVMPIRRGSLVGSRPTGLQGKRVMPQQLHRAESDDSSIGSGTNSNKKAKVDAPPAAALNFLKQLNKTAGDSGSNSNSKGDSKARNKEKDNKEKDSKEKPSSEKNSDGDSIASEEDSERKRSPPSNRQPTRKNPARGARP